MIVIHTPTGTHEFPGEHEVTNNGGTLKLTRAGKTIGAFRDWSYWKETPERKKANIARAPPENIQ